MKAIKIKFIVKWISGTKKKFYIEKMSPKLQAKKTKRSEITNALKLIPIKMNLGGKVLCLKYTSEIIKLLVQSSLRNECFDCKSWLPIYVKVEEVY